MLFLHLQGIEISVASDEADDEAWLGEYLCPPFAASQGAPRSVELRIDEQCYRNWQSQGPHRDGEWGDLFSLDGRFDSYARWSGDDGLLHDETHRLFFRWQEQNRLELVASQFTPPDKRRLALLRGVRELVAIEAQARGLLLLHASAVAWRGRGLAFLGPRQAGKTTTMLACLQVPGSGLITNDRLYLDLVRLVITGMPTVLSIREGSLERLPRLAARLRAIGSFESRLGEKPRQPACQGQRLYVGPHQLSQALAAPRVGEISLGSLVFLSITPGLARPEIVPLEGSRLSESLASNFLWPGRPRNPLSPPAWPSMASRTLSEEALGRLSRSVNCQIWRLGPGCLARGEIEKLLDQAVQGASPKP